MDWFAKNAAAIQAIASAVAVFITGYLAWITHKYVQLTATIAKSSAEQVRELRNAAAEAQKRNTRALADLATRMRNSLALLDADAPRDNQLRQFEQMTESDVARLEVLAPQIGNAALSASASAAVASIRDILAIVNLFKTTNPGMGVALPNERVVRWGRARGESDRSLHEIQNECAALLRPEQQ